ncbi:hypothetical protein CLOM_g16932 [Closterium sp. NIES-68]|nr:hypothetical protein CLOM_g16932 [Closterium sp. NIES-68]GJP64189.1 hypothetical protein CLOP_g21204 [Closterium sp. NIES-67]
MARGTVSGRAAEILRNTLGGVRGRQNAAAWVVAGTAAYFLWVRPEWEKQREREEAMRRWRESGEAEKYAEKVAPRADPQVGGLIIGQAPKHSN